MNWNSRTELMIGPEGVEKLRWSRVLIVGVGGVGGYAVEMLARSGVGHLTLMDADTVSESNINRQLIALRSTVGIPKTRLFAERIADINPDATVEAIDEFLTPEMVPELLAPGRFDLVIDAIDTVAPKAALLAWCLRNKIPVLSSMGAGGRRDPSKVGLTDLWKTGNDGLARAVRQRLKKEGLQGRRLTVVASTEPPQISSLIALEERNKRSSYGTLATIPALFGIYLASAALDRLLR